MRASIPDGCGRLFSKQIANPGAGSLVEIIPPQGERWRIHSIRFTLTTDATVSNRTVIFKVLDGTALHYWYVSSTAQAASLIKIYTLVAGWPTEKADLVGFYIGGMPEFNYFKYGISPQIDANNLQAGDAFTTIYVIGEKWIDNEIII